MTEEEEEATREEEKEEQEQEQEQKVKAFFQSWELFLGFRFWLMKKGNSGEKGKGFVNGRNIT